MVSEPAIQGEPTATGNATATQNAPIVETNKAIRVYFTDPNGPGANTHENGPDTALVEAIDSARLTVDVAIYSLNLWSITDALLRAKHRGLTVRMVMESDNMGNQEVQDLEAAGISIVGDQQEGEMHDKFMVLDRKEVWTGSMNYTVSGGYEDNNDLVCIPSEEVAADYTNEFEKMYTNRLFGVEKTAGDPNPKVDLSGTQVEILFSPEDKVETQIIQLIDQAQKSIHFMMYSFTSSWIGEAIRSQAQAGLRVSGVMDETQVKASEWSEYDIFKSDGMDVRLDSIAGLMHHKTIIIDEKIVITGSYNLTNSAETTNDENTLILFSPKIAEQYMVEFHRLFSSATP